MEGEILSNNTDQYVLHESYRVWDLLKFVREWNLPVVNEVAVNSQHDVVDNCVVKNALFE